MPPVKVDMVDPASDVLGLVAVNCKVVNAWRHHDKEARPGRRALWTELSSWERWQHGGPWLDPKLLQFHLETIKEAGGVVLVAREGEALLGELELVFGPDDPEGNRAHVAWITVDPVHRRRGVGSLLLEHGRQIARDRACHRITTYPEDEVAHAFYESQGFQAVTRIGVFAKELAKSSSHPSGISVQALPLSWNTRPHPPRGFRLVVGDSDTSYYAWTYMQRMSALYALLGVEKPSPNLWLIREEEAEALTVDCEHIRLWFSSKGFATSDFPHVALQKTEQLSRANGVSRLMATTLSSQFPLLQKEGYMLQKEYPYLALSL